MSDTTASHSVISADLCDKLQQTLQKKLCVKKMADRVPLFSSQL